MRLTKAIEASNNVIPLMAALPFEIEISSVENEVAEDLVKYDPLTQRSVYAGKRDTKCRIDDSTGGFWLTKPDWGRDD